jgi:uncharacterized phiE125 gp8 family phage protein
MFRPILVTPPAELPVSTDECKTHAIVDFDDDDALIGGLISAAVAKLDGYQGILGRCIVNQTWRQDLPRFLREIRLPVPDVSDVVVKYRDSDGAEQTVSGDHVQFYPAPLGTLVTISTDFPAPALESGNRSPVSVEFTAGFGGAADVPAPLKVAIHQIVARLYEDRAGDKGDLSPAVLGLIGPYRWTKI